MNHADYPVTVAADIARLRRRIAASGIPDKITDYNLLIGTWNIRHFGGVYAAWEENPRSPKRNWRALAYLAEVIRHFDIVAVQEVKRETSGIRTLLETFLGPAWAIIFSDVTSGSAGNTERLAYIYDTRRVQPSGLAGEIVLPPDEHGDPADQFARTPYIVGFRAAQEHFALLTAHIKYGNAPDDRLPELRALADHIAREIRDRTQLPNAEESNLIVLGDFNIDQRGHNPLFRAFVATGLTVPPQLWDLRTTFNTQPKYYDQIAWFMGGMDLPYNEQAGVIDFVDAVYQDMTAQQMSYRVSDHFPLWVEFLTDRSTEQMARTLGLDPSMPDALDAVED